MRLFRKISWKPDKICVKGARLKRKNGKKEEKRIRTGKPRAPGRFAKGKNGEKKIKKISWGVSHKSGPKIQRQRNNVIVSKENIEKKVGTKHKKLLSPLSSCSSSSFFLFFNLFISFNFFYLLFAEEGAVLFDIYAWAPAP